MRMVPVRPLTYLRVPRRQPQMVIMMILFCLVVSSMVIMMDEAQSMPSMVMVDLNYGIVTVRS